MSDRTERREEIKLRLEYIKIGISLLGFAAIVFAAIQWRESVGSTNLAAYQRMTGEWRENLKLIYDAPAMFSYFMEKKELDPNSTDRDRVIAAADIRLDVMDAILTYPRMRGFDADIEGWRNTFLGAFLTSPVLCARFKETRAYYGKSTLAPIADRGCGQQPQAVKR